MTTLRNPRTRTARTTSNACGLPRIQRGAHENGEHPTASTQPRTATLDAPAVDHTDQPPTHHNAETAGTQPQVAAHRAARVERPARLT